MPWVPIKGSECGWQPAAGDMRMPRGAPRSVDRSPWSTPSRPAGTPPARTVGGLGLRHAFQEGHEARGREDTA